MSREVMEDYDTNGFLSYAYSKKVEDSYKLFSGTMNITVADFELSEFVITYFDKENTEDTNQGNNDVIMIFPAETEEEAFKVLDDFNSKDILFKTNNAE